MWSRSLFVNNINYMDHAIVISYGENRPLYSISVPVDNKSRKSAKEDKRKE